MALLLSATAPTVGAEEGLESIEAPEVVPDCWPHPDQPDVVICQVPAECVDHLYETPECTPPPECQEQQDGTFACELPEHDEYAEEGYEEHPYQEDRYQEAPDPPCWPHPELDGYMECKPPAECVDHLYETPECTPPSLCREQEDGTFACKMPEPGSYEDHDRFAEEVGNETTDRPAPDHEDPRAYAEVDGEPSASDGLTLDGIADELFGEGALFEDEQRIEEARRAARVAAQDAMASFRANLEDLKAAYVETREDLRDRYEVGRAELKAAHTACIEEARLLANTSEARAEARLCNLEAGGGLDELRERLVDEHEALKEQILLQAERQATSTCQDLETRLHTILSNNGLLRIEVSNLVETGQAPLCEHRLGGGLP